MKNSNFEFTVEKSTNSVLISRDFDAALSLVWDAFSKPEILDRWWAPKPFESKTKIMEFKEGGRRFYAMLGPNGEEHWGIQKYTLINPKTHINWLSSFTDKDENINEALPTSAWELIFSEQGGTTKLRIVIKHKAFENIETLIQMGFKEGFTITLNYLDELLSTLQSK